MQLKKGILLIISGFILLSLISCRGAATYDPQTRLQERVEGFIQARQNKDQIALQSFYLNPGKARIGNISYQKSEVGEISYSDDGRKAQVKLKNTMQAMGFTFKDTPQMVDWVWQKGDWYLVINPKAGNPFAKKTDNRKKSPKDADIEKK